jgi:lipopolysaccharide assembly outer membrane protein LptD (OstA)
LKYFIYILPFFFLSHIALGQDTSLTTTPDTSVTSRTAQVTQPQSSGLEGPVKYWADDIYFSMGRQTTYLKGNARIEYQDITLTAGQVAINWKTHKMLARGVADSTDSLGNPVYLDLPVLTEKGNEPIRGFSLEFDFDTQRGRINEGRTNMEPGYYVGKEARKVGKETLFIKDGYFTSCDREDHPHFYFRSSQVRIRVKRWAIARPIIMYIADVPVMAVPFGVFPLKRGRRSGVILPTYGENSWGGRYLERFGFYWAASQYWDATFLANFYEKTGLLYRGEMRYKKRYLFSGYVNGSFSPKDVRTGQRRERWDIDFRHQQKIGQTASLNASGRFQSDKRFNQDYFTDINDRLNQSLTTSAVLSKTWPSSRNSMSISYRRTENLQTGQIDYEFPNVQFSQPSRSIFPFQSGGGARQSWYNNIKYNYNSRFLTKGSRKPIEDDGFERTKKSAWQHTASLTTPIKLLKYINLQQNINFEELWVPEYQNYTFVDSLNKVVGDTVKKFRARHTFSTGVTARTTFYGIWTIPFSPLKVIRHKIDPSIGFSYSPDFSDEKWGYSQTFTDTTGRSVRSDRFAGNAFGSGTPSFARKSINMSVTNLFQGKIITKDEEKKVDLVRMTTSTNYNFEADSVKWADLRTSINAKPHRAIDISANATHSFYKPTGSGTGKRDELVWDPSNLKFLRLLNWNVTMNGRFRIKPPEKKEEAGQALADTADTLQQNQLFAEQGLSRDITRDPNVDALRGFKIPWEIGANFSYSYRWDERNKGSKNFDLNIDAKLQLTENWRIQYYGTFDLIERNIDYQRFLIYRDLHCWEMSFEWSPNPNFSYYRLEIRIKESALRDIKLTKTASGRPVF